MSRLEITEGVPPRGYITKVWNVGCDAERLGQVRWFAQWRRYCFYPNTGTIFDGECLAELAAFCAEQTDLRKKDRER